MPQTDFNARNTTLSITATSSVVSEARDTPQNKRISILLTNNSTNVADIITVSLGYTAAVAGSGIILQQGQSWSDTDSEGYQCYKGPIQAVCATANGVLAIMER